MIGQMYNPYEFPRIKRKGARGLIGRSGPGASRSQLQGSRQPIQRGPGRPVPRGINKTSVTDQEQGGAVSGFQSGAQSGKGVIDAYQGGQKIRAGLGKMSDSITNSDTWANLTGGGQGLENISSQLGFGGNQAALSGTSGLSGGGDFNALGQMDMSGLGSGGSFGGGEASGLLAGSEGATEAVSGLDSATTAGGKAGGMGPYLSYAKIGLDVIDGGPQGQKITGNSFGDAALRVGAAYATGGLSEIGYMFL